jgi:hypothetical protein
MSIKRGDQSAQQKSAKPIQASVDGMPVQAQPGGEADGAVKGEAASFGV